jgi:hypothetical protein
VHTLSDLNSRRIALDSCNPEHHAELSSPPPSRSAIQTPNLGKNDPSLQEHKKARIEPSFLEKYDALSQLLFVNKEMTPRRTHP